MQEGIKLLPEAKNMMGQFRILLLLNGRTWAQSHWGTKKGVLWGDQKTLFTTSFCLGCVCVWHQSQASCLAKSPHFLAIIIISTKHNSNNHCCSGSCLKNEEETIVPPPYIKAIVHYCAAIIVVVDKLRRRRRRGLRKWGNKTRIEVVFRALFFSVPRLY